MSDQEENLFQGSQEGGIDKVIDHGISKEMKTSYLAYAMSVIVSRALPDVRDGLKPVHRRILYSMHENGLKSTSKFRKSATVVGDVIGKYHPHGDVAVYDAMVRLAQDFSLRYPLVLGQGNFGSIDGDSPAAHRYTEAKMEKITEELLSDIEKETIDFRPNYDASRVEPTVLPSKLPNLLLNGTSGIAVGMATNIPPHNIGEVLDAVLYLSNNPECEIVDLLLFIKGPDFPTGGIIYDEEAIRQAYETGRGSIVVRAKTNIEELKGGKQAIIITEVPYQVNKADLIVKIADLVRDKKIEGITDIRDESNKEGIRVVIELKRDSFPKKILNQLFQMTALQSSFAFNLIALTERGLQPKLLNVKEILEEFIVHRKEVITRRTEYELKIAKARAHILEGLKIAIDNIDAVIKLIRASKTQEDAKEGLMEKFELSDLQADAILAMQLRRLAALERQKIEEELAEKMKLIDDLEGILADVEKVRKIMNDEFKELKDKFGDIRRTEVIPNALGKIRAVDTIPNLEMMILLTRENYIKRIPPDTYKSQHRGGKGVVGMGTKEEDEVQTLIYTKNHNTLLFFTNTGRVFKLPAYEVPESSRTAKGQSIVNLLNLKPEEKVTTILDIDANPGKYLFMATKFGTVKKTDLEEFKNIRTNGIIACGLKDNDELLWVKQTSGKDEIVMVTRNAQSIRYSEDDVRSMGRAAAGVRGIKLKSKDDQVVEMDVVTEGITSLLVVTEKGLGKMTSLDDYRDQNRGGSGIKTASLTDKTGKVVGARLVNKNLPQDILIITKKGQVMRTSLLEVPERGRSTQGVYLMRTKEDIVSGVGIIATDA